MARFVLAAFMVTLCISSASAQFDIRPPGPFIRTNYTRNPIEGIVVVGYSNDLYIEECDFQVFIQDDTVRRTLYSQVGSEWWINLNMLSLPTTPEPQLSVVMRVRNKYSGTSFSISRVFPLQITDFETRLVEVQRDYSLTDKFTPRIVGSPVASLYGVINYPNNTTEVRLTLLTSSGDTLKHRSLSGSNLQQALIDTLNLPQYPGALKYRAQVFCEACPKSGYVVERKIPDSLPVPIVTASAGFGPFTSNVEQPNTFTVSGLGRKCESVQWAIEYENAVRRVCRPVSDTIPYDTAVDASSFVYNMFDVTRGSSLVVTANYGTHLPSVQVRYPLDIRRTPPVHTIIGTLPVQLDAKEPYTVRIDSLPPRIVSLRMQLLSGSSAILQEKVFTPPAPGEFVRSGSITFEAAQLTFGSYVVRSRAINDQSDDAPDYYYGFDIRDYSQPFLIADSWGPYSQGDSATITPAVTDVLKGKNQKSLSYKGQFILADEKTPDVPIYTSPIIDLHDLRSSDSVVYWPDDSYVSGKPISRRANLQTIDLPLSARVYFKTTQRMPVGFTDISRSVSHPVFVEPSPGTLTAVPRLDSTLIVTRQTPVTVTLKNVSADASAVRFSLTGTKDQTPVDEQIIPVEGPDRTVVYKADAGKLPVNAKLSVTLVTPLSSSVGSQINRLVNTVPDTLSMVAEPPIDFIYLDWDIDKKSNMIRGVKPLYPLLKFSKIPAQTKEIRLVTYNDVDEVIDSMVLLVPYRVVYDPALVVKTQLFPLRALNTVRMSIRYVSDGGPQGGVVYTKNISTKMLEYPSAVVQKVNLEQRPPSNDNSPILQGSNDIVDVALRWRAKSGSLGYGNNLTIDSVRLEIRDCATNIIDDMLVRPYGAQVPNGLAADTMYSVSKLPLSTQSVVLRLYSKSMTLPARGVVVTAPFTLRTNPRLSVPLGTSYPSYRISDTAQKTLVQRMAITNLDGIVEIDSLRMVDKNGESVKVFPALRPIGDTIIVPEYDFNQLNPDRGPYTIAGLIRTSQCGGVASLYLPLSQVATPRVFPGNEGKDWIFSSKGWGPFQQGRAPETQVTVQISPRKYFAELRGQVGDSVEVGLSVYSNVLKNYVTKEVKEGYWFPIEKPVAETVSFATPVALAALDTSSVIRIHIRYLWKELDGVKEKFNRTYDFPVAMLPFPDQYIEPDTAEHEQSVLAGSSGAKVMPSNYSFRMEPQSSRIDRLLFTLLSTEGEVLDTFSIKPASVDSAAQTSVFVNLHDVAQYPWPKISRDRTVVSVNIGYLFQNAIRPTKTQQTSIRILPRADWLNGITAELNGTPTDKEIPLRATISFPADIRTAVMPVFGVVTYFIGGDDDKKSTDIVIDAKYLPESKSFRMVNSLPAGSNWNPKVDFFGASFERESIIKDGEEQNEFEALYRFEEGTLAGSEEKLANRELRIRSLYSSSTASPVGMVHWIKETIKSIRELMELTTAIASGGLVSIAPTFTIDGSVKQTSVVNIGTEETGALMFTGELAKNVALTERNEFPSSQAIGFTLTGGGGIEASLLGLIGMAASVSDDFLFASGTIFSESVAERNTSNYPTRLSFSRWFNLELSLFFGIIEIDLFKGRFLHAYDPNIMPTFVVFDEWFESVFSSGIQQKRKETTQLVSPLANLPVETPYYRPRPMVASNDSVMHTVHIEQSILGRSGRIVLSTLDARTHALIRNTVIEDNKHGIHDAVVVPVGNDGSAFVAWVQNDYDVFTLRSQRIDDLLEAENVRVAYYDASLGSITRYPDAGDSTLKVIDGKPSIAISRDLNTIMLVWSAKETNSNVVSVYGRRITRDGLQWKFGDATRLSQAPGVERDMEVAALDDGTFLITGIHDQFDGYGSQMFSIYIDRDNNVSTQSIASSYSNVIVSDAEMMSNGKDAYALFARSVVREGAVLDRTLEMYRFNNGKWVLQSSIDLGTSRGVCRHIEGDIAPNGEFLVVIDAYDYSAERSSEHVVYSVTGNSDLHPDSWKVARNSKLLVPRERTVWSMTVTAGPNNVFYVATQELDTLRGNNQVYLNGLQLGQSRSNAAIRAVRILGDGGLRGVPFTNSPTSVDEETNPDLEMAMRYRIKVLDPAPNPVREACVVPLAVQRECTIEVKLFNAFGAFVATLYSGAVSEGIQGVSFTVSELASGHYTVVVSDQLGVAGSVPVVVVR